MNQNVTTPSDPLYITTRADLERLCHQLQASAELALDTEFVGEESFVPKLELIQIASSGVSAVIDFPAVQADGPLDMFWELIGNPRVNKIVHAGRQDLDLFAVHAGQIPKPFFDTQIAAAMVGFGAQSAYANLVQRIVGTRLAKAHTFTNWSARPLSHDQIAYAAEDVQFLLPIHAHLVRKLSALGRLEWVHEEFSRLESVVGEKSRDPLERYQRIRGWEGLKPKYAAVLRDLTAWREGEAKRRNVPRGRVLRDEVLLQLARHPPRTVNELKTLRGVHSSEVERNGEHILKAVERSLALPPAAWPQVPAEKRAEPESVGVVELLQAVLKARAVEAGIAPTLLATSADIQALVEAKEKKNEIALPLLRGWRREVAGHLMLQVLNGEVIVRVSRSGTLLFKQDGGA